MNQKIAAIQGLLGVKQDGDFGPKSRAALKTASPEVIKQIQRIVGDDDDGIWGPHSEAALQSVIRSEEDGPEPARTVSQEILATLQHNNWPLESEAAAFFGYPSTLTQVVPPFQMTIEGEPIRYISCNIKAAASLRRILAAINAHYKGDVEAMKRDGVTTYDGMYNNRNVRGRSTRSMHAYGAAIDIDAEHNPLGATTGRMPRAVVEIFKAEGWRWGGDYRGRKDWMHFEACR